MRWTTTRILSAVLAAIGLGWTEAAAQQGAVSVACSGPDCASQWDGLDAEQIHETIQEAIDYADQQSRADGDQWTVFIDKINGSFTDWDENLVIPADANIRLTNAHEFDQPFNTLIEPANAGDPIITITLPTDPDADTDNLVIEGFSLRGGLHGILVETSAASPLLNRLLIVEATSHGVSVQSSTETGGEVRIINSSISENGGDGVHINDDAGNAVAAYIGLSSLLENGGNGIRVQGTEATATVELTFLYQNSAFGLSADAAGKVTSESNASADNTSGEYENVTNDENNGPTFTAADNYDLLLNWPGKIDTSSVLIDQGGLVTADAFLPSIDVPELFRDFEGRVRPSILSSIFAIGANEPTSDVVGGFYFCQVSPNPIPRMAAGELSVTIRVLGGDVDQGELFLVPQGGSRNVPATHIPLRITSGAGGGFVTATNDQAINTVSESRTGADVVADGHGVIYIEQGGTAIDAEGQAAIGRHVIIDTVPPRLSISLATPPRADAFIGATNDTFLAVNNLNGSTHPAGAPSSPLSTGTLWPPALAPVPIDDGVITFDDVSAGSQGGQAFFNVGSLSNNLVPADLQLQIVAAFIDVPPVDANGDPIPGVDEWGAPDAIRDVAGFAVPPTATQTYNITQAQTRGPGRWRLDPALSDPLPDTFVHVEHAVTTSGLQQIWNLGSTGFIDANDQLATTWDFDADNNAGNGVGLSYELVDISLGEDEKLHFALRFIAEDRAGNVTTQETTLETDPLHIWWIVRTSSEIIENREGKEVGIDEVGFSWDLNRSYNPEATGAPVPVFTYRIYQSDGDYNDVYTGIGNWAPWTPARSVGPAAFQALANSFPIEGSWLLIVVLGADEAGNVERWPADELNLVDSNPNFARFDGGLNPFARGTNWQRFFLKGRTDSIDTTIIPTAWLDRSGTNPLGDPRVIDGPEQAIPGNIYPSPLSGGPRNLHVKFVVNMLGFEGSARGVFWDLLRGGERVASGTAYPQIPGTATPPAPPEVDRGVDQVTVVLPMDGIAPPANADTVFLDDPMNPEGFAIVGDGFGRRRTVRYVFRASTILDADGSFNDGINLSDDPGDNIDTTPATYSFTVVPSDEAGSFISPKDLPDQQPIKIREEQ